MLEIIKSWMHQWGFWALILNAIGFVVIYFFNKFAHDKIVGNDLHHIAADIKNVMVKQDNTDKKIDAQNIKIGNLAEDVSYLKGKMEVPLIQKRKIYNKIKK